MAFRVCARPAFSNIAGLVVREFLSAEFQDGRHVARIEKISRIEAEEARA